MRFAIFTTLFAYATLGLLQLIAASPILDTKDMIVKRDNADIMGVMTKLKQDVDPILAKINTLVAQKQATLANVTPLINQLTTTLDGSAADLGKLAPSSLRKRQSDDEIAQIVAGIVSDIATVLDALLGELGSSIIGTLLNGVDASLNQVLLGLSILLQGVLLLVANLLVNVAQLLRNLAFGLSLGTLGF
ncbi:hypothetical protein FS749_005047 [Ceratobasidium sp. UAMH 11750]|nr:hypothetical protein FS749_005047 [Ceratobasidium sp. UAMH 11750]